MPAHKLPGNQADINKAEYDKRWKEANRERIREQEKARRAADPERFKATKLRYRKKNQEKIRTYAAARWEEKGEEIKAKLREEGLNSVYSARYRQRNQDKCLQMTQAWKDANPERRAQTNAEWVQRNLHKCRTYQHNRRAMKAATGGTLSPDLAETLYQKQRGKCACCGVDLGDNYEMDHIVPLALGGANTDGNIQLLTSRCNRQKGAKAPHLFMQSRGRLL